MDLETLFFILKFFGGMTLLFAFGYLVGHLLKLYNHFR